MVNQASDPAVEQPSSESPGRGRVVRVIGWTIEVLAVIAVLLDLAATAQFGGVTRGTEQAAFSGMGLIVIFGAALWVVIPAVVIAMFRLRKILAVPGPAAPRIPGAMLHGSVLALAVLMVRAFVASDRAPSETAQSSPPAPTAEAEFVEGYRWAKVHGISSDNGCVTGSPRFVDGCRQFMSIHSTGRSVNGQAPVTIRLDAPRAVVRVPRP
jgi:hypothetical protein